MTDLHVVTRPDGNLAVEAPRPQPPAPTPARDALRWYVPYTRLDPRTVASAPRNAVWVDVSSDSHAYFVAIQHIWSLQETFAVLEHDVVCRPDIQRELAECPEPWCVYGYHDICHAACADAWANALGCTRFREQLTREVPDAVSGIPEDARDWQHISDGVGRNLRAAGFTHHYHGPPVLHHHMRDLVEPSSSWWEERVAA